jgi:hypothetical protein
VGAVMTWMSFETQGSPKGLRNCTRRLKRGKNYEFTVNKSTIRDIGAYDRFTFSHFHIFTP